MMEGTRRRKGTYFRYFHSPKRPCPDGDPDRNGNSGSTSPGAVTEVTTEEQRTASEKGKDWFGFSTMKSMKDMKVAQ